MLLKISEKEEIKYDAVWLFLLEWFLGNTVIYLINIQYLQRTDCNFKDKQDKKLLSKQLHS